MAQDVQVRAASTEKDVDDDGAGLWERGVGCRHKASFRVVMIAGGPVRGSAPVLDVISQYRQAVILVLVLDVRLALLYIEAVARLGDGGVQLGFAASFAPGDALLRAADSYSMDSAVAAPVPARVAGHDATGAGSSVRVAVVAAVGLSAPCSHDVLVLMSRLLTLSVGQSAAAAAAASVAAASASAVAVVGGVGEGGDLDHAPVRVLHSCVRVTMKEAPAGDNYSLPEVARLPWILLRDHHMKVALDVKLW